MNKLELVLFEARGIKSRQRGGAKWSSEKPHLTMLVRERNAQSRAPIDALIPTKCSSDQFDIADT
jgi:hypothetical protein